MRNLLNTVALLSLAAAAIPGFSAEQARPGTVNYVEGAAFVEGKQINSHDVGNVDVDAGQVLSTAQGKAEMLLTPGVFLRLDDNSAVKLISPDLTLTQVEVQHGKAAVEVDEVYKQNNIQVIEGGVTTRLLKPGYYEFNTASGTAMVYKGKAEVELAQDSHKDIKDHHEFAFSELTDGKPLNKAKPVSFDPNGTQDDLYNWSSLRSQYLAEANNEIAGEYTAGSGFYPGWYWDPYAFDYTYIGAGPFWSPFGWGFYPVGWGWYGGWYGGHYYGRGYYGGRGFHGHPGAYGHAYAGGGVHSGFGGGGFHGGGGFGGGAHGGGAGGRR